jgi:hypothetical protein
MLKSSLDETTYDERVEGLLQLALTYSEGQLTEQIDFIRSYLQARDNNTS